MSKKKTVALGSDHAGFDYKNRLANHLRETGYTVVDVGCDSSESCHYPMFAHRLCRLIQRGECEAGILICGTGIGMSMAANKHRGIRAAVLSDEYSAELTRQHNDANVLCLGARVVDFEKAARLAEIFLTTDYMGGNHALRIAMFDQIESETFKE